MERVKKIEQEDPNALNNVIDSWEWDDDLKLDKKEITLIDKFLKLFKPIKSISDLLAGEQYSSIQYILPTVKDVKEHIYLFKSYKLIGKTTKALSKEFASYFR